MSTVLPAIRVASNVAIALAFQGRTALGAGTQGFRAASKFGSGLKSENLLNFHDCQEEFHKMLI